MDAHDLAIKTSSQDPNWRTPDDLKYALYHIFDLCVDLADDRMGKRGSYLGPGSPWGEDALQVSWSKLFDTSDDPERSSRGFLNPPYSLAKIRDLKRHAEERISQLVLPSPLYEEKVAEIYAEFRRESRALRIEAWAEKAYLESLQGFTTIGVFPYAPQTRWFRTYVMGHFDFDKHPDLRDRNIACPLGWAGHAALDYWRIPHRVTYLRPDGSQAANASVNTCVIHWGPNPGFVGPWVPSGRYWSYR